MLIVNILLLVDGIAFLVYLIQTKKELTKKKKRKRKDYSISSERTQQERRKKLRQASNLLAGNEPSVPEEVDDIFNIYKAEDTILSENISNTFKIIK